MSISWATNKSSKILPVYSFYVTNPDKIRNLTKQFCLRTPAGDTYYLCRAYVLAMYAWWQLQGPEVGGFNSKKNSYFYLKLTRETSGLQLNFINYEKMVTIYLSTTLYNCLLQPFKGLRTKRCHPIGTNHCIVLRDEHIHTKPEMTGYTT